MFIVDVFNVHTHSLMSIMNFIENFHIILSFELSAEFYVDFYHQNFKCRFFVEFQGRRI